MEAEDLEISGEENLVITEDDEGLGDAQAPSTKIGAASPPPDADGAVANEDTCDARTLTSLYTTLQTELAATRRQVIDLETALQQKQAALVAREAAFEKQSQLIADLSSAVDQLKAAKQTKKQIKKDVAKDVNELKLSLALVESENRRLRSIGEEVQNVKREWKAIHEAQQKELNRVATRMEELARVHANSDEDPAKRKPRGRGRRKKEEVEEYEEEEEAKEEEEEEEAQDDETKDSPSVIRRSARLQAKEAPKLEQAKASPKRIAKRRSRETSTAVSASTKPTPPPPAAKAESPAKRGRPRKVVVEDEQDEETTTKKKKGEEDVESEAEEREDLEIDEGEEEEEDEEEEGEEDVDNESMVDTYGEPAVADDEETREKVMEEPTDAKTIMQQRRERRRAEREKAEAGGTTVGKKRKMETRAKGAEEATAKKKTKNASAEQDKESSPTEEAAASKLKSPAKAAGAKESKLMKMVKTKTKAEQAMRSQQLTRATAALPGPTSEPVVTTPTPSAARVWPPPPPGTAPRPAVAWPPPPPGSAALPATVSSLVAAVRPALLWPPPPPGTTVPQATAPISPAPAAPSATTSSSTTTSPMGPTRDRRADEAPPDYFNRRVALLSGVTLREIADDFAQERNLDEQTVMSLLERRVLHTFETERTKKRERNQRGEEAWMKRFANQEKLVLRLLWRVAKARAAAGATRQPQDKHEHEQGDRLLDSVLWSWANRLANKHEPKVVTTELESLCKAFAGLCKLERRRGRSIVGVFCLDLVLAALSKTEAGRPPRAGQVLQYLRIVSRAFPGALASVEGDDGGGAAMDLEEGADDGLRVLGRTLRLLATMHLGPAAKSIGSGAKRERTKMVDDCLADIATENDWNEDNAPSLDRLLADIVSGISSLPQHNGDESYKLTPRTFVGLKCLELVALWKGWIWTFNDLIVERLWPLLGADSTNSALVTTVRAVGQLARAAIQFLAEPLPLQGSDFLANTMADVLQMDPADSPMGTFSVKLAAAQTILEMTTSAAGGSLPPSSATSGPATGVRSWVRSLSPAHAKRVPPALIAAVGKL